MKSSYNKKNNGERSSYKDSGERNSRRPKPSFKSDNKFDRGSKPRTAPKSIPAVNKFKDEEKETHSSIEGRNPVIELMRTGKKIEKIYILKGSNLDLMQRARGAKIPVQEVDKRKFDTMCSTDNAQGVIAITSPVEYCDIEDILAYAAEKGEKPFIVIADSLNSPHNLGAIIRTAECAGAHGIIIPVHRSVGITPTVVKTSAGAAEHMLISKVTNIKAAIEKLKENNVWIIGANAGGEMYDKIDYTTGVGLVIGGEDKGLTDNISSACDIIAGIPMQGKINSLNASVAAGVLIYEVVRQRRG